MLKYVFAYVNNPPRLALMTIFGDVPTQLACHPVITPLAFQFRPKIKAVVELLFAPSREKERDSEWF